MTLTTVYHKPTKQWYTITEEEALVITDYSYLVLACRGRGAVGPGVHHLVYWCSIGEVTEAQVRNREYIRIPDTPAARVLYT